MAKYFNLAYGQYFFPSLGYIFCDTSVSFSIDIYKTWTFIWAAQCHCQFMIPKEHMVVA